MKKIMSLLVVFLLIISSVSLATDNKMFVNVIKNETIDNVYEFEIEFIIKDGKKGDKHTIETPFPVELDGGEYINVSYPGNNKIEIELTDDWKVLGGNIGGKKIIHSTSELSPIVVNGETILNDFPPITNPGGHPIGERNNFYKIGNIDGDIINWEVVINGDGTGLSGDRLITDEIGDGHSLIKSSIKFEVIDKYTEEYIDELVDMIVYDIDLSEDEINFKINTISPNEILVLTYQTKIENKSQKSFSNQLIIEGEEKITESVEIENWSNIGGEKPEKPTKPTLPQVGESFFKIEYILATVLLIIGFVIRKKESK